MSAIPGGDHRKPIAVANAAIGGFLGLVAAAAAAATAVMLVIAVVFLMLMSAIFQVGI